MCSLFYKGNFKLLMKLVYAHEELLWGKKFSVVESLKMSLKRLLKIKVATDKYWRPDPLASRPACNLLPG